MGRHLHVLTARKERMQRIHLICVLADIWRERGGTVTFGDTPPDNADACICHTDLSFIEDDFINRAKSGVPLVNGAARNILKSNVSQMLLDKDSKWNGSVLIKTNANAHAGEEYAYHGLDIPRLMKIFAGRVIPWQWTGELPFRQYPILDGLADVPDWVWRDNGLVVEKFRPERDGELYVLRLWMFFGDQGYCMKVRGELPIVKSRKLVSVDLIKDVPEEVIAVRKKLGLDFGKIDFVMHDGKAIVFDVNKTPTVFLNKQGKPGAYVRSLADGLDALLK
jgi:hypothetical protein